MRNDEVLTEEEVRTILYYSVDIDDCALPLKQMYMEWVQNVRIQNNG